MPVVEPAPPPSARRTTSSGARSSPERRAAVAAAVVLVTWCAFSTLAARVEVDGGTLGPLPLLLASAILVAFGAVVLERRAGRGGVFAAVGLDGAAPTALLAGLLMSAPTAIAQAIGGTAVEAPKPIHLVRLALATALTEEIVLRGFAFHALARRAHWGAPRAAAVTAVVLALARMAQGIGKAPAAELIEVGLVGAAVSLWFCWLVAMWNDGLWVTIALHFGMNLAWSAFVTDHNARFAGVWPHAGRAASVALSIALTLAARRWLRSSAEPSDRA